MFLSSSGMKFKVKANYAADFIIFICGSIQGGVFNSLRLFVLWNRALKECEYEIIYKEETNGVIMGALLQFISLMVP